MVRYQFPSPIPPGFSGTARLSLGRFGGACAAIRQGYHESPRVLAFPPYEVELEARNYREPILIDIYLTRRNTFGPLHLTPKEQTFYGPAMFRSQGKAFSSTYQVYPSGLLEPPVIRLYP